MEEERALRDGVQKYGAGKWRAIQLDPTFGLALNHRSNVDLNDKWRNLHAHGGSAEAEPTVTEVKLGAMTLEVSSSGREQSGEKAAKRRKEDESEDASGGRALAGAHEAHVNELMAETQRAKREAETALAAATEAEREAERAEREAWEAEKLASELVTEAHRQKVGLPVEGAEDVADVAAELLDEDERGGG